ncbi:GSCOCG00012523001-RA-CDS, partial [Cotesia congregata]
NLNLRIILFFTSTLIYSSFYKHLLISLIRLEFIILNLSIFIYFYINFLKLNIYFISFF